MKDKFEKTLELPVLFLVFKRPETTKRVFEKIRDAQPPRLYVSADGPRENRLEEVKKCEEVRRITTNVDWNCEVKTLFRGDNLGAKVAVSKGIDWFFNEEEMGIILEDDCVPNDSFFSFCEELLYRYKDKEQVMTISGNNFQPKRRTDNSYYFSRYMHCWGWASWKRAWKKFDIEMNKWPLMRKQNFIQKYLKSNKAQEYWEKRFNGVYNGEIDSWAHIWQYSIWYNNGLNIIPEVNIVKNIGFGEDATHTLEGNNPDFGANNSQLIFPLSHPQKIEANEIADRYTQNYHYQTPWFYKIYKKIKIFIKMIGGK